MCSQGQVLESTACNIDQCTITIHSLVQLYGYTNILYVHHHTNEWKSTVQLQFLLLGKGTCSNIVHLCASSDVCWTDSKFKLSQIFLHTENYSYFTVSNIRRWTSTNRTIQTHLQQNPGGTPRGTLPLCQYIAQSAWRL